MTPAALSEHLGTNLRESAETTIANIESVAEACTTKSLSLTDVCAFQRRANEIVPLLLERLRAGSMAPVVPGDLYGDEAGRLVDAVRALDEAWINRSSQGGEDEPAPWSLSGPGGLIAWWDNVDGVRSHCEGTCLFWRQYWRSNSSVERERALACIEEIEKRIPLFRSHLLSKMAIQYDAIEKCMLLIAQVPVYADHRDSLRVFSTAIFGPPIDESDASVKISAFAQAVLGPVCGGQDWLQQRDSRLSVWKNARHLAWLYTKDGRLDSNGKMIREVAYLDPLYQDGELLRAGTIEMASLESARHPDVHVEIEDFEAVLKQARLKPLQRRHYRCAGTGRS